MYPFNILANCSSDGKIKAEYKQRANSEGHSAQRASCKSRQSLMDMAGRKRATFDKGKLERLRAFIERFDEAAYTNEPEEIRLALKRLVADLRDWLSRPAVTMIWKHDALPDNQWERLMEILFHNLQKGGNNGKASEL